MTVSYTDWLATSKRGTKPLNHHTQRGKVASLSTVRRIACEYTGTPQGTMSDAELATWLEDVDNVDALADRLAATRKQGTCRNILLSLTTFERYAKACGWTRGFASITAPPPAQPSVETFTAAELDIISIGARMKGARWSLFVETLMHTGARVGSILNVTYADVHLDHAQPHLYLTNVKGGGDGYAPLNKHLQAAWSAPEVSTLAQDRRRHYSKDVETFIFPWTYENARQTWTEMLASLKIPHRSIHKLRHTLATRLIANDAPILAVSRILGHSKLDTTARFYVKADALRFASLLDA